MTSCERLKRDIIRTSKGILNPYKDVFKPKDLGLKSSDYGSFSDHCEKRTTKSSKWCGCGALKGVSKHPFKYKLR